jgi:superfamily II DNA/RNA helicase
VYSPRDVEEVRKEETNTSDTYEFGKYDREMVLGRRKKNLPTPINSWFEAFLIPKLRSNLERSGYMKVRKVQQAVIPMILKGKPFQCF